MKTHNTERQEALQQKRELAKNQASQRLAKVQSEKDARTVKGRVKAGKVRKPLEKPTKGPRRRKPGVTSRGGKPGPALAPASGDIEVSNANDSLGEGIDRASHTAETPPAPTTNGIEVPEANSPLGEESNTVSHTAGIAAEQHLEARSRTAMEVLKNIVASDRKLRRFVKGCDEMGQVEEDAINGPEGLKQLNAQIEDEAYDDENDRVLLQSKRRFQRRRVEKTRNSHKSWDLCSSGLRKDQMKRNSRLYDFADLPRDNHHFGCLSDEFWRMLDECHAAKTASKDLELELREAEQQQEYRWAKHDQDLAASLPGAEVEDRQEESGRRLGAFRAESLSKSLEQARSAQFKVESTLNSIACDLLVRAELLSADRPNEPTQDGKRNSGSSDEAQTNSFVPEVNAGEPSAKESTQSDRSVVEEQQIEESQEQQNNTPLTEAALATLLADLAAAREKRTTCDDEAAVARSVVPSYAQSWDEEDQGAAQVKNIEVTNRAFVEANNQYLKLRRKAQCTGAIWYTESQTSEFLISRSERAREKEGTILRKMKILPFPRQKGPKSSTGQIQRWASMRLRTSQTCRMTRVWTEMLCSSTGMARTANTPRGVNCSKRLTARKR